MMNWLYLLIPCWLLAALLVMKLDAVLVGDPTDYSKSTFILSCIAWPVLAVLMLTTDHHCDNGSKDLWAK